MEVEDKLIGQRKKQRHSKKQALADRLAKLAPGADLTPEQLRAREEAAKKTMERITADSDGIIATPEQRAALPEIKPEQEEDDRHLLRLHVWKDDPANPVKVLPDVQEFVL